MGGYVLTEKEIELYLDELSRCHKARGTVQQYRRSLLLFLEYIGPNGEIDSEVLESWQADMIKAGNMSNATINARTAAVNGLLRYIGRRGWTLEKSLPTRKVERPGLTRAEYHQLLLTARALEDENTYFLVKTIGTTGIQPSDLRHITVETVQRGYGHWHARRTLQEVTIPQPLRDDLLAYCQRIGKGDGPIFTTSEGRPLHRSVVWGKINALCYSAQVNPDRVSPRSLALLYQETYNNIATTVSIVIQQAYDRMLAEENQIVGWEGNLPVLKVGGE